jgi:hypothetical protein
MNSHVYAGASRNNEHIARGPLETLILDEGAARTAKGGG